MSRALFGDAEIDRIDQRKRDRGDDLEHRMPFAGLARERNACIRQ